MLLQLLRGKTKCVLLRVYLSSSRYSNNLLARGLLLYIYAQIARLVIDTRKIRAECHDPRWHSHRRALMNSRDYVLFGLIAERPSSCCWGGEAQERDRERERWVAHSSIPARAICSCAHPYSPLSLLAPIHIYIRIYIPKVWLDESCCCSDTIDDARAMEVTAPNYCHFNISSTEIPIHIYFISIDCCSIQPLLLLYAWLFSYTQWI